MGKFSNFIAVFTLLLISTNTYSQQRQSNQPYDSFTLISASLDSNKTVLVVKIGAPKEENIEAVLSHSIGWVIEKKKLRLVAGENRIRFDMTMMAEGTYRLFVRSEENTWTISKSIKK
jgi:hypothetical protein